VSGPASILIARDEAAFLKKAAMLLIESTIAAVESRQHATWSLSGGNTPKKLFQLLSEPYYKERIPWPQLHLFWGDERCVAPEHADSNYKMVRESLLSKVAIPADNVHRMPAEMTPPNDGARTYDQALKVFFKHERPFPIFDVMMLGMGDDGHTASLFPGTSALEENEKWVASTFVEKLSAHRLTLTYPVINNARRILILCAGDSKAPVLKEVLRTGTPVRFPVQRVQPTHGELIWILDEAAASKLTPDVLSKTVRI
jgi:6-phosphogluconolactonase